MEVQRIQYVVSSQLLRVLFPTVSHRLPIIDYRYEVTPLTASNRLSSLASASVVFVFVF